MANPMLYPKDIDTNDPLYQFTLARIKGGSHWPAKNIPLHVRGIDMQSENRRASGVARRLHQQYINYIHKHIVPKDQKQNDPVSGEVQVSEESSPVLISV